MPPSSTTMSSPATGRSNLLAVARIGQIAPSMISVSPGVTENCVELRGVSEVVGLRKRKNALRAWAPNGITYARNSSRPAANSLSAGHSRACCQMRRSGRRRHPCSAAFRKTSLTSPGNAGSRSKCTALIRRLSAMPKRCSRYTAVRAGSIDRKPKRQIRYTKPITIAASEPSIKTLRRCGGRLKRLSATQSNRSQTGNAAPASSARRSERLRRR